MHKRGGDSWKKEANRSEGGRPRGKKKKNGRDHPGRRGASEGWRNQEQRYRDLSKEQYTTARGGSKNTYLADEELRENSTGQKGGSPRGEVTSRRS